MPLLRLSVPILEKQGFGIGDNKKAREDKEDKGRVDFVDICTKVHGGAQ